MKYLQPYDEVLRSWKGCIESGLPVNASPPVLEMDSKNMQEILQNNQDIVSVFEKCIKNISNMLDEEYLFLY